DIPEERFMPATDIAKAVRDIYHMSDRTVVEEVVLRPQLGDI
ncbi:MAG: SDR family NAD(P)-dependent oxidoreductase, partial [Rhodothermales bacterium]